MGIKRTASEGTVKKAAAAKLPAKRKIASRPVTAAAPVENGRSNGAGEDGSSTRAPRQIAETTIQPPRPEISPEVIALRAYFISERRRMNGEEADSLADWLEAERQLLAEQRP